MEPPTDGAKFSGSPVPVLVRQPQSQIAADLIAQPAAVTGADHIGEGGEAVLGNGETSG